MSKMSRDALVSILQIDSFPYSVKGCERDEIYLANGRLKLFTPTPFLTMLPSHEQAPPLHDLLEALFMPEQIYSVSICFSGQWNRRVTCCAKDARFVHVHCGVEASFDAQSVYRACNQWSSFVHSQASNCAYISYTVRVSEEIASWIEQYNDIVSRRAERSRMFFDDLLRNHTDSLQCLPVCRHDSITFIGQSSGQAQGWKYMQELPARYLTNETALTLLSHEGVDAFRRDGSFTDSPADDSAGRFTSRETGESRACFVISDGPFSPGRIKLSG